MDWRDSSYAVTILLIVTAIIHVIRVLWNRKSHFADTFLRAFFSQKKQIKFEHFFTICDGYSHNKAPNLRSLR